MQQEFRKMFSFFGKKFVTSDQPNQTPAQQVFRIVSDAVHARIDLGKCRAIASVARSLRISESRVTEIMRGKVARVWADELVAAQDFYARHCDAQAAKLAHEAEIYKQRAQALKDRIA